MNRNTSDPRSETSRKKVGLREMADWWWIAINGASCTACFIPCTESVAVSPVPELLLGFKTQDEQLEVQHFLLTAPTDEVAKYMKSLPSKIRSGEVHYIRPENPEPPTEGHSTWDLCSRTQQESDTDQASGLAELVFTAGDENMFKINNDGIHVEFNVSQHSEYGAMIVGLGHTVMQLQLGCEQQVGEFVNTLPTHDELWNEDGTWAGMPFEKRYAL